MKLLFSGSRRQLLNEGEKLTLPHIQALEPGMAAERAYPVESLAKPGFVQGGTGARLINGNYALRYNQERSNRPANPPFHKSQEDQFQRLLLQA